MARRSNRVPKEDPLRRLRKTLIRLNSAWVSRTYPFASLGSELSIHYRCEVSRSHVHRMAFGNSVVIEKDVVLRVHVRLDEEGEPVLVLEDGCVIGARTTISAKNGIYLERNVEVGTSVLMQDHSHAYQDVSQTIREQGVTNGGRIRIGEGSSIGHAAVIHCDQGELTLGRNCVVAPNSLVNRSFPSYSLIAGNPARVVKQFDPVKGVWVLGSSRSAATEMALDSSELQHSR